jgi:luciferase family oxidoreductase group 1
MSRDSTVLYSLLDLCPITQGGAASESFRNTIDLAQHAERWGYHRYWLAEHHNIPGIASAATSVVIAVVGGATKTLRIGSGGIMLPNHSPLVIAEQFGTLESLYPGRIDLGVGRAPGGDMRTARALRRNLGGETVDTFPDDVRELQRYFAAPSPAQPVRAIPGQGLNVPIYILGSSDFGARLAAEMGLPFGFASHFAPDYLHVALELYRRNFQPSQQLDRPHAIVGVNVFAADTDAEARRLFTSLQQQFLNLIRGTPGETPPPVDSMQGRWSPVEQAQVERMTRFSVIGSPTTVQHGLGQVIADTQADEIIITGSTYDHAARLHSFEIAADVFERINAERTAPVLVPSPSGSGGNAFTE